MLKGLFMSIFALIISLIRGAINKGKTEDDTTFVKGAFSLDSLDKSKTEELRFQFATKEEAEYVHNAISRGSSFDAAIEEYRSLQQRKHEMENDTQIMANDTSGKSLPMEEGRTMLPSVVFCTKCGAELPEGSLFCNKCGFEIARR